MVKRFPLLAAVQFNTLAPQEDLLFIDRLIAHEELAFELLVRLHGPRMLAVALRYLGRPADAEDAVQDAFVNVVRAISGFKRESSLATWLHRIVVNCCLMQLRRRRRKPERALDEQACGASLGLPHRGEPPASAYETIARAETRSAVRRSLQCLPSPQRAVLLLRDVDGLPLHSIAEVLDLGLSSVKLRLHHARRSLHAALLRNVSGTHP